MTEQRVYENALNGLKNADVKIDDAIRYPAIKAIEKQIPKKIAIHNIPKTSWTKAITRYTCPSCDRAIGFNGLNYCSYCGQKLDWSDEE